jgi:hypothetical protein
VDRMKETEMHTTFWWRNALENVPLEDRKVHNRIILRSRVGRELVRIGNGLVGFGILRPAAIVSEVVLHWFSAYFIVTGDIYRYRQFPILDRRLYLQSARLKDVTNQARGSRLY